MKGDSQGHASGNIKNVGDTKTVELKIPREIKYFQLNIWVRRPNIASINVISPTEKLLTIIDAKTGKIQPVKFVFS